MKLLIVWNCNLLHEFDTDISFIWVYKIENLSLLLAEYFLIL